MLRAVGGLSGEIKSLSLADPSRWAAQLVPLSSLDDKARSILRPPSELNSSSTKRNNDNGGHVGYIYIYTY